MKWLPVSGLTALLTIPMLLAGCAGTAGSQTAGMTESTTAGASWRAIPLDPLPSDQSQKSKEDKCSRLESVARYNADYGSKSLVDKAMKEAKVLGCQFPRPKLVNPEKAPSMGYVTPSMDGISYRWADNPNCGYLACFEMTIRADTADCPK